MMVVEEEEEEAEAVEAEGMVVVCFQFPRGCVSGSGGSSVGESHESREDTGT